MHPEKIWRVEKTSVKSRARKELVPWTLIKQASGRSIFFEVDLELWKRMDPYRNFDGEQSVSFKSGNFSWRNDNASERYILGTGIATSAILPLLALSLATILLNRFRIS